MVSRSVRVAVGLLGLTMCIAGTLYVKHTGTPSAALTPQVKEAFAVQTSDADAFAIMEATRGEEADPRQGMVSDTRIIVVPHHLVAARAIALAVRKLKDHKIPLRTVFIVSPDHFQACPTWVCVTDADYRTVFGTSTTDVQTVAMLEELPFVTASSTVFEKEHGVYVIVPFIRHYIPDARIVPIALAQHGVPPREVREALRDMLSNIYNSRNDVALIISSDFSHYLPLDTAQAMDASTTKALCAGDAPALLALNNPAQSDCPWCLWLANAVALDAGDPYPTIFWHTNSAELLNDTNALETTSHMGIAYTDHPATDISNTCDISTYSVAPQ
jgi:AmmeMemoRadiSam system protein B